MNATEADRERAHRMLSREARLEDVDAVAEALAAEREAARAPFLALAGHYGERGPESNGWLFVAAEGIRRAAEQQQ